MSNKFDLEEKNGFAYKLILIIILNFQIVMN